MVGESEGEVREYINMRQGDDVEMDAREVRLGESRRAVGGFMGVTSMREAYERLYKNRTRILGIVTGVLTAILVYWSVSDLLSDTMHTRSGDHSGAAASMMNESDYMQSFKNFIVDYGKVYPSVEERDFRYNIFKRNLRYINNHNSTSSKTWKLGMNRMGDLLPEERAKASYGLVPKHQQHNLPPLSSLHPQNKEGSHHKITDTVLAEKITAFEMEKKNLALQMLSHKREGLLRDDHSGETEVPSVRLTPVDWRETGCMPAIKDQGQCGSCWAFAAVTAVEADLCIREGIHELMSEQQIVDCALPWPGCDGGTVEAAWSYMKSHDHMICLDRQYPYKAQNFSCEQTHCKQPLKIEGALPIETKDDITFELALKVFGPITIAMDAGGDDFAFYKSGIFAGECGLELNHAVIIVGWGVEQDTQEPYWIMQNSWGVKWGEHGYMKLPMAHRPYGKCGIHMEPAVPLITKTIHDDPQNLNETLMAKPKPETPHLYTIA